MQEGCLAYGLLRLIDAHPPHCRPPQPPGRRGQRPGAGAVAVLGRGRAGQLEPGWSVVGGQHDPGRPHQPDGRAAVLPVASRNEDGIGIPDFTRFEGRLAQKLGVRRGQHDLDPAPAPRGDRLLRQRIQCRGRRLYLGAGEVHQRYGCVGWFAASVAGIKGFDADVFKPGADKSLGDAVTVVDPYTVRIKQGSPNAFFLLGLSLHPLTIFDAKAMKAHATEQDPWSHGYANTENVAGYGAYCLERWTMGDEFIVRANPNYYRGKPPIDRIVMKKVPQSSNRVVTLRSGQAGLIQGLTPREYFSLRGARGRHRRRCLWQRGLVHFAQASPPRCGATGCVREAMAYAIDIQSGFRRPAIWARPGKWGRPGADLRSPVPQKPCPTTVYRSRSKCEAACSREAGYPNGAGLEKYPGGSSNSPTRRNVRRPSARSQTVVQSSLRAAGFPRRARSRSRRPQMASRRMVNARSASGPQRHRQGGCGRFTVYARSICYFLKRELGGAIVNTNQLRQSRRSMIMRAKAARASLSADERMRGCGKKMQDLLAADLPWIPIAETRTQWAYTSKAVRVWTWYPGQFHSLVRPQPDPK